MKGTMKGKKTVKDTVKDNSNYNLNNSTRQSIMENYKLTTTHNVFHVSNSSDCHVRRKEDYVKQQVVNCSPSKMPDYRKMSVPELKVAVAKYGVKPLSKAAMINQLSLIWNYLHRNNYLDEEDEEENTVRDTENIARDTGNVARNTENVSRNTGTVARNTENVSRNTGNIRSTGSKNVSSDNINYIKGFPELSDETKREIKNHIISKYYERIIRYEQLEFDDIFKEIVDQGIRCTEWQLQHYLDILNIQNKSLKRTDEWKKCH